MPDRWIRERAKEGMIEPFEERLVRDGVISYGLSSFGYDLRAAPEWRVFVNAFNTVVDPKNFDTNSFVELDNDHCIIPPNSFALTRSIEYMRVPEDVMVVALGKSTYARVGIVANVTPLEPGWEGHVTLELSNTTRCRRRCTPTRGSFSCCSFRASGPRSPMRTARASTRARPA